jgi:predicted DNA binding CopG/RHH family protein
MPYIQSTTTENTVDSTSSNSTDVSQLFVEEVPQQTSEESLERQRINNMSFIELFKELGRIGYGTENTSLTHEFALQELINHASSNNEMPYTEIVKYVFEQHWGE